MRAALVQILGPPLTGRPVLPFFPPRPTAAGHLLVLLFLGSVVLAAGEAYYRYDHDTTDSLSYSKTSQRWFSRHWKSNAAGFRDNVEYADRIQPGKRRITLLGDSFTAAHGIKDVEDRFANRIRKAHPEWEVHLLAQSGWDTGDELEALRTAVQRGDPVDQVVGDGGGEGGCWRPAAERGDRVDWVVVLYMLNDVADILPAWATTHQRI